MTDEKILKEEILKEEELENVAGGTAQETHVDCINFRKYGFNAPDFGYTEHEEVQMAVFQLWKKVGIDCQPHENGGNEYYHGSRKICRDEAWAIADEKLRAMGYQKR